MWLKCCRVCDRADTGLFLYKRFGIVSFFVGLPLVYGNIFVGLCGSNVCRSL